MMESNKDHKEYIAHLAAIVQYSDDAIISKSLNGIIKSWNKGGEKMFGYTAAEAIGKHISLIIPANYLDEEKEILNRIRNNEIVEHFETVQEKKDGETFFVSITVSPLKDQSGNIIGVSKIARDITARNSFAAKLTLVNKELIYRNEEKEKRAAELIIANKELAFQNEEKEHRAEELVIANQELAFQNTEKEKRASELIIANRELAFQNEEKEHRAEELVIANQELAFQNTEKEKRASELIIANRELAFQNEEKEHRAEELVIANKELAFQNTEKEKRASELIIANKELAFQNTEKEKRAEELIVANKGLAQFAYVASHDLQEPLRTVANYIQVFEEDYLQVLDGKAFSYLQAVKGSVKRMSLLINSLLDFSRLDNAKSAVLINCNEIIAEVVEDLDSVIKTSQAVIEVAVMPKLTGYEMELRQLFQNLITNALKFRKKDIRPEIQINAQKINDYWQFSVTDNGIGIAAVHFERVFNIFQRLHTNREYEGSGIGLANCKKIVHLHRGKIWVESTLGQGATFYFTIPNLET